MLYFSVEGSMATGTSVFDVKPLLQFVNMQFVFKVDWLPGHRWRKTRGSRSTGYRVSDDGKPGVQGRLVTGSEMTENQGFKVAWLPGQRWRKTRVQGRLVNGSEMTENQGFKVAWLPGQRWRKTRGSRLHGYRVRDDEKPGVQGCMVTGSEMTKNQVCKVILWCEVSRQNWTVQGTGS